jgi:DNA-directed RNA polymerase specialized sigma24 family protein
MPNSRSIPTETWIHAHKVLVHFFTRKGVSNPEDLAQETLMALWSRQDYHFDKEDDFLKVCYGFAKKILLEGYRLSRRHAAQELDPLVESPVQGVQGLEGSEVSVFLGEVCGRANAELLEEEKAAIEAAIDRGREDKPVEGKQRVRLHRARKKLAKQTGWQN